MVTNDRWFLKYAYFFRRFSRVWPFVTVMGIFIRHLIYGRAQLSCWNEFVCSMSNFTRTNIYILLSSCAYCFVNWLFSYKKQWCYIGCYSTIIRKLWQLLFFSKKRVQYTQQYNITMPIKSWIIIWAINLIMQKRNYRSFKVFVIILNSVKKKRFGVIQSTSSVFFRL